MGTSTLLPVFLFLAASCSDDTAEPEQPKVSYDIHVDVVSGSDNFTGVEDVPLKPTGVELIGDEAVKGVRGNTI